MFLACSPNAVRAFLGVYVPEQSISQDDIDSLLAELQGGGAPQASRGRTPPEMSLDDVDSLLGNDFDVSAPAEPSPEGADDAVGMEQELLGDIDLGDTEIPEDQVLPPDDGDAGAAQAEQPEEGGADQFAGYDFSNIQIEEPPPEPTKPAKASRPAPAQTLPPPGAAAVNRAFGASSASSITSEAVADIQRELALLREQIGKGDGGGKPSKLKGILVTCAFFLLACGMAYQTLLLHNLSSGKLSRPALQGTTAAEEAKALVAEDDLAPRASEKKSKKKAKKDDVEDEVPQEVSQASSQVEKGAKPAKVAVAKSTINGEDADVPPPTDDEEEEADAPVELPKKAANKVQASVGPHFYQGAALKRKGKAAELAFNFGGVLDEGTIQAFTLPNRLVIDIASAKPKTKKLVQPLRHPIVTKLRVGVQPGDQLRIVIEAKTAAFPKYKIVSGGSGFSVVF